MSSSNNESKGSSMSGDPVRWLVNKALLLTVGVVALYMSVSLIAEIWPWIAGIALVTLAIYAIVQIVAARRRKW
ncbi:hypothetical protein [Tsukamurella tyrosinosolvens]|uniref:hypothetical protein n=1 Tax=Tsukamurella tyrosinosolvens TaxID=57704 RepID=UPI000A6CE272|nr:hypothetical protein [Tsukamurella tyrosinosolvens]